MNSISAIGLALLRGEILTIKTAFEDFGVSNLPREASRSIEQKFGIRLSKIRVSGKTRYGIPVSFNQYRLNKSDPQNQKGIELLKKYISDHLDPNPKTTKEEKIYKQAKLLLQ